jgi:hypothetical protein
LYVRVTTSRADPTRPEDLNLKLPAIKAKLEELDGIIDWYAAWRPDGQGVVFTVFDGKAAAEASLNEARGMWAGLSGLLKAAPKAETFNAVETLDELISPVPMQRPAVGATRRSALAGDGARAAPSAGRHFK